MNPAKAPAMLAPLETVAVAAAGALRSRYDARFDAGARGIFFAPLPRALLDIGPVHSLGDNTTPPGDIDMKSGMGVRRHQLRSRLRRCARAPQRAASGTRARALRSRRGNPSAVPVFKASAP